MFFFSRRLVFLALGFATSAPHLLLGRLLLAGHGLLGALARPRVGVGALPVDRKAPAMPDPLVRADLDLTLDVLRDLAPQVALDLVRAVDVLADPADLFLGQLANLRDAIDPRAGDDLVRPRGPDPIDVAEGDVHPLIAGKVEACDSSHSLRSPCLALPLLVPRVGADDPDLPAPTDDLALVAHLLHRRPDLHLHTSYLYRYVMRPRVRSYGESSTRTRSPGRIRM